MLIVDILWIWSPFYLENYAYQVLDPCFPGFPLIQEAGCWEIVCGAKTQGIFYFVDYSFFWFQYRFSVQIHYCLQYFNILENFLIIWRSGELDYLDGLVPFCLLRYMLFKFWVDSGFFYPYCFTGLIGIFWFQVSRSTNLLLHMNGTYRVHWADRLGFCKGFKYLMAWYFLIVCTSSCFLLSFLTWICAVLNLDS